MGAFSTGRVGSVFVDIEGDLSKLRSAMQDAVPEAQKAGERTSSAFTSGSKKGADDMAAAFKTLGIQSSKAMLDASIAADQAFQKISTDARSSAGDIQRAYDAMIAADKKWADSINARQAPEVVPPSLLQRLNEITPTLDKIASAASSLGAKLTVGVTVPLATLATASIKAAADMDSLERGLTAVTGSAEETARQMADLREIAKLPGLGLKEAVEGSVRLQSFGFSAKEAKEALMAFGNAIATVGGGKAELDRVIVQLGQMAGAGKVLTQDLRPIIQTVPQVAKIIKDNFGSAALSEPGQAIENLGLTSKQAIAIIVKELSKLPQVTGGLKNDLENFQDTMFETFAKIGKELTPFVKDFTEIAVPAIKSFVDTFAALPQPVKSAIIEIGIFSAALGPFVGIIGQVVGGLSQVIKLLGGFGGAAATTATQVGGVVTATEGAAGAVTALSRILTPTNLALASFGAAALATADNLDAMEKQMKNAADQAIKLQVMEAIGKGDSLDVLEKKLKSVGMTTEDLKNMIQGASIETEKWKAPVSTLGIEIVKTTAAGQGLSAAAAKIREEQESANAAVTRAKATYQELSEAYKRGAATAAEVHRAQVDLQAAMDKAAPKLKENADAAKELANQYTKVSAEFLNGKATAEQVMKAWDKLTEANRALGQATGFTTEEIKKQAEAFKDEALFAPKVSEVLQKLPGLNYEQAKAVAQATDAQKKNSDAVFTAADKYRAYSEAAKAGLLPLSQVTSAANALRDAIAAANPDIDRNSDAFRMLEQQAGLTANSVVQVGQVSEGMNKILVNGITVIQGSATAARDAGNAYGDMARGASDAGVVIDILTGKVERLADVAARAKQTMGTDWPGNSQQGLNSAANSNGTGVDGSGGAQVSGAQYLSLLAQMGAPSDVIHRAAEAFGFEILGENQFAPKGWAEANGMTGNLSGSIMKLSDMMRAADQSAQDLTDTFAQMAEQEDQAKKAIYSDEKQQAIEDYTDEAQRLQEELGRLSDAMYQMRMEGQDNTQEYFDMQSQLFNVSNQLADVNQHLALMGVTTTVANAGLQAITTTTNALSGAAKVAADNIIGATAAINAAMPKPAGAAAVNPVMPSPGQSGSGGSGGAAPAGAAGGSLVNVGNGKLVWVPPGGVTLVQNINGGTFSSTAFVDEVGSQMVDKLTRDVGAKL